MNHAAIYCKTLDALDRAEAVNALHQALMQLNAAEKGTEGLNNRPTITEITRLLGVAGHIGFDAVPTAGTARPIRRIVVVLETRSARNYGFRYTDTTTGITVEAQITGGESNILHALTHDGRGWLSDYYRETVTVPEKHLFALPCAGCTPDEIRKWVAKTSAALLAKRTT